MSPKYREPNVFDKINDWIAGVEGSVITLLTAIAPWFAPLAPAYMTYTHCISALQLPTWVALSIAAVVEVLGLATVSTGINFWKFNQKNKNASDYRKAPVEVVFFTFIFYLLIITTSNVLLDAGSYFFPDHINWVLVAVRFEYTLLTVPAAVIISVRQQHREIIDAVALPNSSTVLSSTSSRTREESSKSSNSVLEQDRTPRTSELKNRVFTYLDNVMQTENRVVGYMELKTTLGLSNNAASRLRKEWISQNSIPSVVGGDD